MSSVGVRRVDRVDQVADDAAVSDLVAAVKDVAVVADVPVRACFLRPDGPRLLRLALWCPLGQVRRLDPLLILTAEAVAHERVSRVLPEDLPVRGQDLHDVLLDPLVHVLLLVDLAPVTPLEGIWKQLLILERERLAGRRLTLSRPRRHPVGAEDLWPLGRRRGVHHP